MIYSVIDVETTGLSANAGDRILEIGIARLEEDGRIVDVLDTLVNPEGPVRATHVHGISAHMVEGAPTFTALIPKIQSVLDGTVIAAHNASFDMGFLKAEYRRSGVSFKLPPAVCTLVLARKLLPHLKSKSLESCRRMLGLSDEGAHNALADARSAAHLLQYLKTNHPGEAGGQAFFLPEENQAPGLFDMEDMLTLKSR